MRRDGLSSVAAVIAERLGKKNRMGPALPDDDREIARAFTVSSAAILSNPSSLDRSTIIRRAIEIKIEDKEFKLQSFIRLPQREVTYETCEIAIVGLRAQQIKHALHDFTPRVMICSLHRRHKFTPRRAARSN